MTSTLEPLPLSGHKAEEQQTKPNSAGVHTETKSLHACSSFIVYCLIDSLLLILLLRVSPSF